MLGWLVTAASCQLYKWPYLPKKSVLTKVEDFFLLALNFVSTQTDPQFFVFLRTLTLSWDSVFVWPSSTPPPQIKPMA